MCGCSMHKQFLLKALEQAFLGRGKCSPNPSVGAIAVKDKTIIAQAWHHGAGKSHAEQLLLTKFPEHTSGVTLYVTLEPCNHWGRTPPCVDAIIRHGIEKVVYAYNDPNPIVSNNKTPALLKEHGIEVIYYPVAEITDFYKSYNYWTINHKPWVTVKIAQTLNGKIAPFDGKKVMLSNAKCAEFTHKQRLYSDVILTTATTINIDNPLLNARVDGHVHAKHVAILDANLKLNMDSQAIDCSEVCHIFYDKSFESKINSVNSLVNNKNYKKCVYHGFTVKGGKFDLTEIICHLGKIGYHDVWVEAGGKLFTALHAEKLVQKTYIYVVPTLLEDDAINAYHSMGLFDSPKSINWQNMDDNMLAIIDWE